MEFQKNKGGRPKGSPNKLRFKDHMTKKEIDSLVNLAKKRAETDATILKFLLEQIFGRAVQPLGNETNEVFKLQIIRPHGDESLEAPQISGPGDLSSGEVQSDSSGPAVGEDNSGSSLEPVNDGSVSQ